MPHRRRLFLLLAFVSACADEASEPDRVVRLEALPQLEAHEELRLGHLEDPELGFTRIGSVDVDDDGNVYVLELGVPEIRVLGPAGDLEWRIGRRGQGPGEFEGAPRFGVKGDTVWTLESTGRITLFDRRGRVLSTGRTEGVMVPLPAGFGFVLPQAMGPDGRFLGFFNRVAYNRDTAPTGVAPNDSIPWPIVTFDATGAVIDTVGWVPRPPPRMWRPPSEEVGEYKTIEISGRPTMVPQPAPTLPTWLPTDDGYLAVETPQPTTGDAAVLTVTRLGLAGDTVHATVLGYEPVPFLDADLDSIAARAARGEPGGFASYVPGRGPPPDWEVIANRLRAEMDFPPWQLPLEYPWLARDGSLWLRLSGNREIGTATWVVLDPDGRPRGRLDLPATLQVRWARDDTFWAVVPDELEVPWLVRYRIDSQ